MMTGTEPPRHENAFNPHAFRYAAFLSYARADQKIVDDFFQRLSRFRTPGPLRKLRGDYGLPPKLLSIFLDRKSAQLGAQVPDRLQDAISNSAFLIVFCSAASAKSHWVNEEIKGFLSQAPTFRILPVFARGSIEVPFSDLLPPSLAALGEDLPIGADMVQDGGPLPVSHKLLGALLGLPQDRVAREQEKADKARRTLERAAMGLITGLSAAAAVAGWTAYTESLKAQKSLIVSLDALENTTPFAVRMVREGRVKVSEVETYAEQLDRLFASAAKQDLSKLPDITYALGQVSLKSADLSAVSGRSLARLTNAKRSFDTLMSFQDEPGPVAQELICDAALETANALGALSNYSEAIAYTKRCDEVAAAEIGFHDVAPPGLVQRRVSALTLEARLLAAQDRFTAALSRLSTAEGSDYLGQLEKVTAGKDALFLTTRAELGLARANILEAMGRTGEAFSVYHAVEADNLAAGVPVTDMLAVQLGLARIDASEGSDPTQAAARLERLVAALQGQSDRDAGQRSLKAYLVDVYMTMATIYADWPVSDGTQGLAYARLADEALSKASALSGDLLSFDGQNAYWQTANADRLLRTGSYHFSLFEDYGAAAPICAGQCLSQSEQLLRQAEAQMIELDAKDPNSLRMRADIELRVARSLRTEGQAEAVAWIDRAQATWDEVMKTGGDSLPTRLLRARIDDERADLLLAQKNYTGAIALYRSSLKTVADTAAAEPDWLLMRRDVMWERLALAKAVAASGDQTAARAAYDATCREARSVGAFPSRKIAADIIKVRAAAKSAGSPCL